VLPVLGACLLSAGLFRLAFPVPGWFPLAWVALVPWLVTVRAGSRRAALRGSWAMGLAAAGLGLSWQYIVTVPGAIGLTFYVALYFPLFAALARVATGRLRVPFILTAPLVWTGLEYLRSWLFTGFPWLFLGHSQQPWTDLVQVSDLVGVYAASFMVMACNALVAETLIAWRAGRLRVGRLVVGIAFVAALVAVSLGYGRWRLARLDPPQGPRVGIVQGNIPQEVKNTLTLGTICDIFFTHWTTTLRLREQARDEPLALIVWPESMVQWPLNWKEPPQRPDFPAILRDAAAEHDLALPDGVPLTFRDLLWALARQMDCPILVGAHTIVGRDQTYVAPHDGTVNRVTEDELVFDGQRAPLPQWRDPVTGTSPIREVFVGEGQKVSENEELVKYTSIVFNSAYLFRPDERPVPVERYDKIHLVPFGEYVPLPEVFWFVRQAVPYAKGFSSADRATIFEVNGHRFGVLICFEDAFPRVVRRFVMREDGADFLINISNDGWFKDSHELEQHLGICSLRAVEFRTGIVRCTNTGISGILGPDGRAQTLVRGEDGDLKEVRGVTAGRVRLRTGNSVYARHGDVFAGVCLAFATVAFIAGLGLPLGGWVRRRLSTHP
jgi:apolipoprotein N-acyltransferase